ncbi:MAG: L,D-transpeptidase [Muribaculaceae bacterium]|nr:L,D-transpeptidase [Muribaculaceae bacterium]
MHFLRKNNVYFLSLLFVMMLALACSHKKDGATQIDAESPDIQLPDVDTLIVVEKDEPEPEPEITYEFKDSDEAMEFLANRDDASLFKGGIIPVMAKHTPLYAAKLMTQLEKYSSFIIVDKASMRVILYDKYGQVIKAYDMACAKNYGTKHKKADARTPEGFFSLEGRYNSTDWLFTDDDGKTSDKKGQFGPRFLRIKTPVTMQIGIHGTGSPWSIGHRTSHGCIRITNENIMELYDLVEIGMPVIILPGKRDRAVNRKEGYDIPYFPTAPKYAMSEEEKKLKPEEQKPENSEVKDEKKDSVAPGSSRSVETADSVSHHARKAEAVKSVGEMSTNATDSVSRPYLE